MSYFIVSNGCIHCLDYTPRHITVSATLSDILFSKLHSQTFYSAAFWSTTLDSLHFIVVSPEPSIFPGPKCFLSITEDYISWHMACYDNIVKHYSIAWYTSVRWHAMAWQATAEVGPTCHIITCQHVILWQLVYIQPYPISLMPGG